MNKIKLTIVLLFFCLVSFGQLKNDVGGFWKLESTAFRDERGVTNGTNNNVTIVGGKVGNAGDFNGTTSYVTMGDVLDFDLNDPFSFSFWMNIDDLNVSMVVSKMESSGNFRGWGADISTTITFVLRSVNPTNMLTVAAPAAILTTSTWYYIAIVYPGNPNGTGMIVYKNAVAQSMTVGQNSLSTTTVSSAPLNIGSRNDGSSRLFNGKIDEVIIYNFAISQTFIDLHYAGGNGRLYVWENFINGKINYSEWLDYSLKLNLQS